MSSGAMVALLKTAPRAHRRRVAVVLNTNARRVDGETLGWVRAVVPSGDLFVSRTRADGVRIADSLISEGVDAVLFGGGDGTFAAGVAALAQAAERRGAPLPDVGVLRLGTGNAVAQTIGAAPATPAGLAGDLRRARTHASRRALALLEVEGRPTMFAGFGLDAQILEDLGQTLALLDQAGLAGAVRSANLRYLLSVTSRSIPRFVMAERAEVVAVNRGAPALTIDVDGNPIGAPIPAGRVLWRGHASLAAVSSVPYYGLAMKMFPHAEKLPGRFQVRLSDLGAAEILLRLPALWKGRCESPRIHDFLCDEVELIMSRPSPFQSGGDLLGERGRVTIGRWRRPVAVV